MKLSRLCNQRPTTTYVSWESMGTSFEGREIRVVKICKGGCGNKPAMYIQGGTHAREWVSPATVTFFINELTDNFDEAANADLLDGIDWYIVPVNNPDGYVYTQVDRLWRKTRSLNDLLCDGVDTNRNYGEGWGTGGSSSFSCSDAFMGPGPFSEAETQVVRDFVTAHKDNLVFFMDVHSYSQFVMYPWGHLQEDNPYLADVRRVAEVGYEALNAVHGMVYRIDSLINLVGMSAGGSIDWTMAAPQDIKYSYGFELRDTGEHGFLLPEDQITPTAEEAWAWHYTAAREMIAEFGGRYKN